MPAPSQASSSPARRAWALVGLILASAVAQTSLLQLGAAPGASAANVVFLLGVAGSLLAHELVQRWVEGGLVRRRGAGAGWGVELASAAAGPLTHVVLALAVIVAARIAYVADVADALIRSMAAIVTLNIVLGAANLVPALPLDGGRLLRAVIWALSGDARRASRATTATSEVLALLTLAGGLAAAVTGDLADAWSWLLVGAVVWGHARGVAGAALGFAADKPPPAERSLT